MNTNLINFLKEHPEQDFTVEDLAKKFGISEVVIRTHIIPEYLKNWKEGNPFLATTVKGVCATYNENKVWESRHWKTVRFSALRDRCELEKKVAGIMFHKEESFVFAKLDMIEG
jgi:hypothetical protein